ncbi:Pycsar system effector family protein [Erythrobacter alti]|uniref:Pycsar system effector family protein n=1 Tax=Erythrobacter alti TaxID=1896145 RepID=UPI0030F46FF0
MDDTTLVSDDTPSGKATHGPVTYSQNSVHMLRTVQNNTLQLSQMADQKASILMGATFLVFSIAVSRSLVGELPWSLAILALFAFLSSLLAVLAVLPSVRQPQAPSKANPLFFGHFSAMDEDAWQQQMLAALEADETVFRAMLHDIYQNGIVLQRRKYRFLGYAYRVFIVGLVVTLASFGIEFGKAL